MHKHELMSLQGIGPGTAAGIRSFRDWNRVDSILEKSRKSGYQLITIDDPDYSGRLKEIYDPPLLLWCRGNTKALDSDSIAVVGTRNPSHYGRQMASKITGDLIDQGLCIISGLAYGIDSIAHRTAVERSSSTIAVLGSGLDRIYPTQNIPLANAIIEQGGAIITEFPPGTKPDSVNFPVRNRIVSGLALGTLIVETANEGGSMITANLALEQNREVFAIPHVIDSGRGVGCNSLIKKGCAKLVQNIQDIMDEIPFRTPEKSTPGTIVDSRDLSALNEQQKRLCSLLEKNGVLHVDQISHMIDVPVNKLLAVLLELEISGYIRSVSGKQFLLI
ncbi:MAG: DNA-processing protein DprA [Cyclonatronaceae bacterium]